MRHLTRFLPVLALTALPLTGQTLQEEMAQDLRAVGEKYVQLAQAVPESAYARCSCTSPRPTWASRRRSWV